MIGSIGKNTLTIFDIGMNLILIIYCIGRISHWFDSDDRLTIFYIILNASMVDPLNLFPICV